MIPRTFVSVTTVWAIFLKNLLLLIISPILLVLVRVEKYFIRTLSCQPILLNKSKLFSQGSKSIIKILNYFTNTYLLGLVFQLEILMDPKSH